mmetsp:Transcript_34480/g.86590  ORF Transcript_34480/g.86590 Transcript_34480/m.86590 type:complete len:328 (+) Transcript_34480:2975-3958(+)
MLGGDDGAHHLGEPLGLQDDRVAQILVVSKVQQAAQVVQQLGGHAQLLLVGDVAHAAQTCVLGVRQNGRHAALALGHHQLLQLEVGARQQLTHGLLVETGVLKDQPQLLKVEQRLAADRHHLHNVRKALAVLGAHRLHGLLHVGLRAARVVRVCAHHDDATVLGASVDALEPELDARVLLLEGQVPDEHVDGALTQEELMRGVVLVLTGKVPHTQVDLCLAPAGTLRHQRALVVHPPREGDVGHVDAVRTDGLQVGLAALLGHAGETAHQRGLAHVLLAHHHHLEPVEALRFAEQRLQVGKHRGQTLRHGGLGRRDQRVLVELEIAE